MQLGFFGGTFDPPHRGHLAVARAAAATFALDEVLFVPTGQQPLKPEAPIASFAERLAMVSLLCAEDARFQASAWEAPHADGSPNYTIETLRQVAVQYPRADLFVLVGADAFAHLRRWRAPADLLRIADWIVVSRSGSDLEACLASLNLSAEERARVHPLEGVAEPASATGLRRQLQAKDPAAEAWLTPEVAAYIRRHGLYTAT